VGSWIKERSTVSAKMSKYLREESLEIDKGRSREPSSPVFAKRRCLRAERDPMESGISKLNVFELRISAVNCLKFSIEAGNDGKPPRRRYSNVTGFNASKRKLEDEGWT
jgi:hypothetical protein